MIIQKLTIQNFRSYYGTKVFEFSEHLNLILGSNGDGKTTFFEALNWVLTPDYTPDVATYVSAKLFKELKNGGQGLVSVAIEIKNNSGQKRRVERKFTVTKNDEGEMRIEGKSHKAVQFIGPITKEMISVKDVFEKEQAFPAIIKKYHIFKGEDQLNVFNDKTTLQTLIDMFSEIKDIEPYKAFAAYAEKTSQFAVASSKAKADEASQKLLDLQSDITKLNKSILDKESEKEKAKRDYDEAVQKIEAIDSDYDVIQKVAKLEKEIEKNENLRLRYTDRIDEDYTIKLLDQQWILMGFAPVLKEYNRKMESFIVSKNNIEEDYRKKQEDEIAKARIDEAKSQLEKVAWSRHDVDKMRYSLREHYCLYCGNDLTDGSKSYEVMKQRMQDILDLITPKPEEKRPEIKKFFTNRNIEDMQQLGSSLAHTGKDIESIMDEISDAEQENDNLRETIDGISHDIEQAEKEVTELYATSSTGENLKEYVSSISVINQWHEKKSASANNYNRLRKEIKETKELLARLRANEAKSVKATGNSSMIMVHTLFRLLYSALCNTGDSIYVEFLDKLAKEANVYLARLNVDDFTGVIKIYLDMFDNLKIELQDKNGKVITNPNTSLLTTMHISILFAISEMTKENRSADYPLIFDAPTSSFDEGKDKTFYECLNTQVSKQCIVVTKSYLYKDDTGEFVLDKPALSKLNCKKYRIKKLTGFDKLDITTIDTQVEELKED